MSAVKAWSKDAPTEPGFYWVKWMHRSGLMEECEVVKVYEDRSIWYTGYPGSDCDQDPGCFKDAMWWGPLECPPVTKVEQTVGDEIHTEYRFPKHEPVQGYSHDLEAS